MVKWPYAMLFRSFLIASAVVWLCPGSVAPLRAAELDGSEGVYVRLEAVVEDKTVRKVLREISIGEFQRAFRLSPEEIHAIGYANLSGRNFAGPRKEALRDAFESAVRQDGLFFVGSDTEVHDGILQYERTHIRAAAYYLPGYEVVWEGISEGRYKVVIRAKVVSLKQIEKLSGKFASSATIISELEEHMLPLKVGCVYFKKEGIALDATDIEQIGDLIRFTLPHSSTLEVPVDRVEVRRRWVGTSPVARSRTGRGR